MKKASSAARVNAILSRNSAAYSEGRVEREVKDHKQKTITDKLYQASKLGKIAEVRKNGKT